MACCGPLSEDQLQCSICLDLFRQPVSLPCGHNFCKACIKDYWDKTPFCRCPLCTEVFSKRRAKLRINYTLREMADNFRSFRETKKKTPSAERVVFCDVCASTASTQAAMSCLECLTSYCESHLEPHRRVPGLTRHMLITPADDLEGRICKKHGKLLSHFCRYDQTFVCHFCTEVDHRAHQTVPLETEYKEKRLRLASELLRLQEATQRKEIEADAIGESARQDASRAASGVKVLSDLKASVEKSKADCHRFASAQQSWAAGAVEVLRREIQELTDRRTELGRLLGAEDHLQLLRSFPSAWGPSPGGKEARLWSGADRPRRSGGEALNASVAQLALDVRRMLSELSVTAGEGTAEEPGEEPSEARSPLFWLFQTEQTYRPWEVVIICISALIPCCLTCMFLPCDFAGVMVPALACTVLYSFMARV